MKIGQGSLSSDSPDHSRHIEQRNRGPEKWIIIGIEAKNVMPKMFADVEEIAGAAAEIENVERRRAVEPKVLRALDVDVDPISDVFEAIDLRRPGPIRILMAQIFKLKPIDVVQNPALVDGMGSAAEMFERAREELFREKFSKLA